jgi:hypothetical protein
MQLSASFVLFDGGADITFSEVLVNICWTTEHNIQDDSILHEYFCLLGCDAI